MKIKEILEITKGTLLSGNEISECENFKIDSREIKKVDTFVSVAEGKINIGNSAIMRWAINNTAIKIGKDGNKKYEKIEAKLRKNDPFMAFVAAMSAQELLDEEVIYV